MTYTTGDILARYTEYLCEASDVVSWLCKHTQD